MSDRDLLEIFDAALPRLEPYGPRCVPKAGSAEAENHRQRQDVHRGDMAIYAAATGAFGIMAWFLYGPWLPIWYVTVMCAPAVLAGLATVRSFLRLAFGPRLEQALPAGTDAKTAQLEDGTWSLIRYWNADSFVWNQAVAALRLEVSGWQLLKNVPEARDVEWTEQGSRTQAEGLIAAMQGLIAERASLVARKDAIEHGLLRLSARLRQLKASEDAPTLALPPPSDDSTEDG